MLASIFCNGKNLILVYLDAPLLKDGEIPTLRLGNTSYTIFRKRVFLSTKTS